MGWGGQDPKIRIRKSQPRRVEVSRCVKSAEARAELTERPTRPERKNVKSHRGISRHACDPSQSI
jgi:hypothetical protein